PVQAQDYFAAASKQSAVQSLARQVPVGPNGVEFRQVVSKPTANWVDEGGRKPSSQGEIGLRSFKPHKIAAITVASAEVVRANPGNYSNLYREQIAEAFAVALAMPPRGVSVAVALVPAPLVLLLLTLRSLLPWVLLLRLTLGSTLT